MRNFKKLQEFVDSYNKFCTYYPVKVIEEGGRAYILGLPTTLATLYLLLQNSVVNHSFYLDHRDNEMVLMVLEFE